MNLENDYTDSLLKSFRKIKFPFPRAEMTLEQREEIEKEIFEIEDQLKAYKKYLKSFKVQ